MSSSVSEEIATLQSHNSSCVQWTHASNTPNFPHHHPHRTNHHHLLQHIVPPTIIPHVICIFVTYHIVLHIRSHLMRELRTPHCVDFSHPPHTPLAATCKRDLRSAVKAEGQRPNRRLQSLTRLVIRQPYVTTPQIFPPRPFANRRRRGF